MWFIKVWEFIKSSPQIIEILLYYLFLSIGLCSFIYFGVSNDKRGAMFLVKTVIIYFMLECLKGAIL